MKSMAVVIALACIAAQGVLAQNAVVQAMLNAVSRDSLRAYDSTLERASGTFSRVSYTPGNDSSVQYILRSFKRAPELTRVDLDTFIVPEAAPPYNTQRLYNVFAMIPGKKDPKTAVVIGAHLDTYAGHDSTWTTAWKTIHAPGADDNGTGVASVIEASRVFARAVSTLGFSNDYTLIFVAFNAEEAGVPGVTYPVYLYGSTHFTQRLRAEGYTLTAAIITDMVGYNTILTSDVVSNDASLPIGTTAVGINAQYGLGLSMNAPPFVYATYSDHSSFWGQGYPAILLLEHAPPNVSSSNYRANTLYHTTHDTLGSVNFELVRRSAQLVIGTAAAYAVAPASAVVTPVASAVPGSFALEQNFPNPFNPSTTIRFSTARARFITLTIVDVLGREVARLVHEPVQPGTYDVVWNAGALPSGVYVAVLRGVNEEGPGGADFLETKKLLMQK